MTYYVEWSERAINKIAARWVNSDSEQRASPNENCGGY